MADNLLAQIMAGVFAMLGAVAGGVGIGRRVSSARRERAQNEAESSVFETALATTTAERDRWQIAAKEAWDKNARLERQIANLAARVRFQESQLHVVKRLTSDDVRAFLNTDAMPLLDDSQTGKPYGTRSDHGRK